MGPATGPMSLESRRLTHEPWDQMSDPRDFGHASGPSSLGSLIFMIIKGEPAA